MAAETEQRTQILSQYAVAPQTGTCLFALRDEYASVSSQLKVTILVLISQRLKVSECDEGGGTHHTVDSPLSTS